MLALGLGLGLVMPNITIAVQNALPTAHRGVGTATLAFFRSLGGLIGVAGAGAILSQEVAAGAAASGTAALKPDGLPSAALSPEAHAALVGHRPARHRHRVHGPASASSASRSVMIFLMPELPLRGRMWGSRSGPPRVDARILKLILRFANLRDGLTMLFISHNRGDHQFRFRIERTD